MHIANALMGSRVLAAKLSRKSKSGIPKSSNPGTAPSDREHKELVTTRGSNTIKQAVLRRIWKRSRTKATDTSAIDIVEVIAATESSRKNRVDHNLVALILAKISGNVTNTNVVPSSELPLLSSPKLFTAGNMISPIMKAIKKSSKDTVTDVRVRLVF